MPKPLKGRLMLQAGAEVLLLRPELAQYIAVIAQAWTEVEIDLGILLATILEADMFHSGPPASPEHLLSKIPAYSLWSKADFQQLVKDILHLRGEIAKFRSKLLTAAKQSAQNIKRD